MNSDLELSEFWRWRRSHGPYKQEEKEELSRKALEILIADVRDGRVTCLDGVDSPLSKRIRAHHQRRDFEMNCHWITTSQDWTCPCCGRCKFEISRIGKRGQILAKLVIHHDHMSEVLKARFHISFEAAGTEKAQVEGHRLVERIGKAFAAYEEVLVCENCNNADADAKKLSGTPASFSFSIGQIRQFIRSSAHAPHDVDPLVANQMWQAARPAYELRMKLIDVVAKAAATDSHWYEPYARTMKPIPLLGSRPFDLDILEWVSADALCKALGPNQKQKVRNLSRWRKSSQKRGRDLPPNFLAMLLSSESRAPLWHSIADEWRCPVCYRTKYETVYVKETNKVVFNPNSNPSRYWSNAPTICGDCTSVLMSLKGEAVDSAGVAPGDSYSMVTPEELANIIVARPHSPHLIRASEAAALVDAVARRLAHRPKT